MTPLKSCCVIMFILHCVHVLEARKKMEVVPVFMDSVQKGSPFSRRLAFWRFYFVFFVFWCPFLIWSTCNSICWCWHWRRKRIQCPHLFVFLLLLKQNAFCRISQEWCSLLFQARHFHALFVLNSGSPCFNTVCSNRRLASMLPKGNWSGPLWRTTQSCDFFF